MRPIVPVAAVVLLAAGAVSLPALTQAAQAAKHHTWKKANIDTAAMSASMTAQNPNAFSPAAADPQPGAVNAGATTSADTAGSTAPATATGGMSTDTTAATPTAPAGQTDPSIQTSGKDESATTTNASHKAVKHSKHKGKAADDGTPQTQAPATTSGDQQPGAIPQSTPSSSDPGMQGNSAPAGAASSPGADTGMTPPDAGKAATTPPATSDSSSASSAVK